jgi:large repetitive protein
VFQIYPNPSQLFCKPKSVKMIKNQRSPKRTSLKNWLMFLLLFAFSMANAQSIQVISITPSATSVMVGTDVTFSVQYRCAGITGNCNGQSIVANLPASMRDNVVQFSDAFTTNAGFNSSTGDLSWTATNLPTGTTGQVTFVARFPHNYTPDGTTATISAGGVNAPPITATTDPLLKVDKVGPSSIGLNGQVTYNIALQNRTPTGTLVGAVIMDNVVMTDVFPAGATFVGFTKGSPSLPNPIVSGNTLTFNLGTLYWENQASYSITLQYPSSTFPVGSIVTNNLSAVGSPRGNSNVTGTASSTATIQAPNCDVRIGFRPDQTSTKVTAGANTFSNYGQGNNISVDLSNASNVPAFIDGIVTIPPALLTKRFVLYNNSSTGVWSAEYKTNTNNTWRPLPNITNYSTPYNAAQDNVSSLGLNSGEYVTQVHVFSVGAAPAGGAAGFSFQYDFTGTDQNGNAVPNGTNIVTGLQLASTCNSGGFGAVGGPSYTTATQGLLVTPPYTKFYSRKEVNPSAAVPGAVVDYTLFWDLNEVASSSPPIDPIFTDLLPAGMEYVPGTSLDHYNNPTTATVTVIDNYNGTGRQLVRWSFTGIYAGNAYFGASAVKFKAKVKAGTPVGIQSNIFNVSSATGTLEPENALDNVTDVNDLDGIGGTSNTIIKSAPADLNILQLAAMESYKWVQGSLDAAETRYPNTGLTTPGGLANYRLVVRNLGNIPMTGIKVVDILPFVGDQAVIGTQTRLTQWRPNMASTVNITPSTPGIQVYYSTSQNPCRPEVYNSAGCTNNWSLTPPADLTTVQSLKFDFGGQVLAGGDSIQLAWQMRAPIDAPTAGEIAWNSFAYVATRQDNNVTLAPSEPVKVGIAVQPAPPSLASLGNYVWIDANNDGIQNEPASSGVNGVKVYLLNASGTRIDSTITSNFSGNPGYYLFPNLTAGTYAVEFVKPSGYTFTTQTTGTTDGSDANTTTGKTPNVTLAPGDNNLTLDAGLYLPPACTKPNAGVDQSSCINGSSTLTGSAPTTGTWTALGTNGAGASLGATASGNATVNFSNTASGTYSFIYTVSGGCSDTMNVTIGSSPSAPSITGTANACIGDTSALTGTPSGGTWSSSNTSVATVSNAGVVSAIAAGTATITYGVSNSCGTTNNTLIFTSKAPSTSTSNVAICPTQLPYSWNGSRASAGTYTFTTTNAAGCDSVATLNLTVKATTTSTSNIAICPTQLPYSWNGSRASAGTYTFTTTNAAGCDSVATLNLTLKATSTSTSNIAICPTQLPYSWNGSRASAGTYTFTTTNAAGCDSVATLNLTLKAASTSTSNVAICPTQLPYSWNGSRASAGTYTFTTTNAAGCDSVATLNLTVKATSTSSTNITICSNQLPNSWNGLTFTAAGTQTANLTNSVGCDSAATLVLTVVALPNAGAAQTVTCNVTGTAIMAATGTGTWSAVAGNPGSATIATPTSPTTTISAFSAAGVYSFKWTNAAGCSSTTTITVGSNCCRAGNVAPTLKP